LRHLSSDFLLALSFTSFVIILAGLPPLPGFLSKYLILISLIKAKSYAVAIFMLLISLVSTFYYVKLILLVWLDFYKNSNLKKKKALSLYKNKNLFTKHFVISVIGIFIMTYSYLTQLREANRFIIYNLASFSIIGLIISAELLHFFRYLALTMRLGIL